MSLAIYLEEEGRRGRATDIIVTSDLPWPNVAKYETLQSVSSYGRSQGTMPSSSKYLLLWVGAMSQHDQHTLSLRTGNRILLIKHEDVVAANRKKISPTMASLGRFPRYPIMAITSVCLTVSPMKFAYDIKRPMAFTKRRQQCFHDLIYNDQGMWISSPSKSGGERCCLRIRGATPCHRF